MHVGMANIGGQKCLDYSEAIAIPKIPLTLIYCDFCTMTFYKPIPEAKKALENFYENQPSTYTLLSAHDTYLNRFASWLTSLSSSHCPRVLEIGCNDGQLLEILQKDHEMHVTGVEPSRAFLNIWADRKLNVINGFFDACTAKFLAQDHFDIIVIRHVLEHIERPDRFLKLVSPLVQANTILVIECPYLPTIINKGRFENISYAHQNYFTIRSISEICSHQDLGVSTARQVATDGGSFVATIERGISTPSNVLDHVTKEDLKGFLSSMTANRSRLIEELRAFKPEQIVGYGAGAKGPHLLSLYGLEDMLSYIVDDNPAFHGQYLAGSTLKIVSSEIFDNQSVKAVVNLAPTHSSSIRKKLDERFVVIDII